MNNQLTQLWGDKLLMHSFIVAMFGLHMVCVRGKTYFTLSLLFLYNGEIQNFCFCFSWI